MARASFFLTRTDADSIRQRQLKSGLTLVFLVLVDAAATMWLFFAREGKLGALLPELRQLTSARAFKGGTGDLVALLVLRVALFALAGGLAVVLGKQRNKAPPPPRARSAANLAHRDGSSLREPLLPRSVGPAGDDAHASDISPDVSNGDDGDDGEGTTLRGVRVGSDAAPAPGHDAAGSFDPDLFAPSEEDQRFNARASFRRDCIVEVTFLCCIAFQAFVAVKSVAFYYDPKPNELLRTVLLFGVSILAVNAQSAYFRKWVKACTVRTGVLRPDFHAHELQFHDRVVGHVCDMCGLRLNAGSKGLRFGGFRCKTCDFDCCMRCFCRKNRDTAEGGVRGDKGTKANLEGTPAQYLWRVLGLAKLEWALLTLAILTTVVTSAASLFVPHFQGAAFDAAIARDAAAFDAKVSALLFASAAVAVFSAFKRACFSLTGQRLNYKVRISLFRTILRQDIAYFDGVNTGDLLSRLSYDVNNLTSPCNTVLSLASQNVVVIAGALVMCFYTCWRLAMVSFAVVMPITYLIKRYARWSQTLNREISAMLGLAATAANEALGNIRTVRATSSEAIELARYEEHAGAALRAGVKDAFGGALTVMLTNLLELGTSVLILWLGGGMAMERPEPRLTIGALITFQLYFNAVTSAYTALTNCLTSLVRAAGSASRVFSLKDNLPDIDPDVGSRYDPNRGSFDGLNGEGRGPSIEFENATFWYQMRPNHVVIDGLSMRINSGSTAALVGKSGGGKTTLVSLLLRYYDVKGGSVKIDGVDLRDLNLESVHKHVGLVAQDTQIFNHTIAGNIEYGCGEKPTRSAVEAAARRAHAHDFIQTFPDGYDTRLGERGVRLSGGQRQRLAIARVFLRNPRLLLLDEATSALDVESEAAVQKAIDALLAMGRRTAVVVAHRLSTVRDADAIHVVVGGKVAESGTHDALLAKNGVYAGLVSLQAKRKAETVSEAREETA